MQPARQEQNEQDHLPGMSEIELVEGMSHEERLDFKRHLLGKISEAERFCRMVDDSFYGEGLEPPELLY